MEGNCRKRHSAHAQEFLGNVEYSKGRGSLVGNAREALLDTGTASLGHRVQSKQPLSCVLAPQSSLAYGQTDTARTFVSRFQKTVRNSLPRRRAALHKSLLVCRVWSCGDSTHFQSRVWLSKNLKLQVLLEQTCPPTQGQQSCPEEALGRPKAAACIGLRESYMGMNPQTLPRPVREEVPAVSGQPTHPPCPSSASPELRSASQHGENQLIPLARGPVGQNVGGLDFAFSW